MKKQMKGNEEEDINKRKKFEKKEDRIKELP